MGPVGGRVLGLLLGSVLFPMAGLLGSVVGGMMEIAVDHKLVQGRSEGIKPWRRLTGSRTSSTQLSSRP